MDWSILLDTQVFRQTLVVATPVILAAQGEVLIERSGVLNVAVEGMMALGAAVGFLVAHGTGSNIMGLLAAVGAGALLGLVLAYAAVRLQVPQLTLGLALLVFGAGLGALLYRITVGLQFVPPQIRTFGGNPGLVGIPGGWLLGLPGPVYGVLGLAALLHGLLFFTPPGLRVRACGENPRAADLQGVNVFALRQLATVTGSMLIGAAGALLPMMLTGTFSDGMVAGRGWIALMLVILGRWQPFGVVLGGWLFGYVEALQYQMGLTMRSVPPQFLLMLPYVFVVLVAVRAYRGAAAPRALMRPYDREVRG